MCGSSVVYLWRGRIKGLAIVSISGTTSHFLGNNRLILSGLTIPTVLGQKFS